MKRIIVGHFQQESNSFSPVVCGLDMFRERVLLYGEDVITKPGGFQIGAFLQVLKGEDYEIIPSISAWAGASGPVTEEVYEEVESTLLRDIKTHGPVDGVLLGLHGATMTTGHYDGTGRLLERIRREVGDGVVISASLDSHANITKKMMEAADILVGHHTFPHVDTAEVSQEAAMLMVQALKGEARPVMAMCKLPMIHQAEACNTGIYPFKKIIDLAKEVQAKEGVLSVTIFQMQPWMDVEDAGASVIVIADGNLDLAGQHAKILAKEYWDMRKELKFELTPLEEAVERAVTLEEGPVVISDAADSPSGGAPGDSTAVLAYLLKNSIDIDTLITIVDAEGVKKAMEIGVGNTGEFLLGGKIDKKNSKPVKVTGTVKAITDGEYFVRRKPNSKRFMKMGRTAVLKVGNISMVVMENSSHADSTFMYRSQGLEPLDAKLVVVKSPLGFRATFEELAKEIYVVDTPGATSSNLLAMPFKKIRRPLYPFDDIDSLDIQVDAVGHAIE